jgi:hypothetical protein
MNVQGTFDPEVRELSAEEIDAASGGIGLLGILGLVVAGVGLFSVGYAVAVYAIIATKPFLS